MVTASFRPVVASGNAMIEAEPSGAVSQAPAKSLKWRAAEAFLAARFGGVASSALAGSREAAYCPGLGFAAAAAAEAGSTLSSISCSPCSGLNAPGYSSSMGVEASESSSDAEEPLAPDGGAQVHWRPAGGASTLTASSRGLPVTAHACSDLSTGQRRRAHGHAGDGGPTPAAQPPSKRARADLSALASSSLGRSGLLQSPAAVPTQQPAPQVPLATVGACDPARGCRTASAAAAASAGPRASTFATASTSEPTARPVTSWCSFEVKIPSLNWQASAGCGAESSSALAATSPTWLGRRL
jgi:hypothetical protein